MKAFKYAFFAGIAVMFGWNLVIGHVRAASPLQADPVSYGQLDSGHTFSNPYQMAVDGGHNLYVTDTKLRKYDSSGNFLIEFALPFSGPNGVAVAQSGSILITNYLQDRIDIYSSTGTYQSSFGSTGTGTTQFDYPYALAVDSTGAIFVADANNNRVQKFDSLFNYVLTISGDSGSFSFPEAVAVDGSNNVYVLDSGNNRVQKFNSSGVHQLTITGNGGDWNYPEGLTVDTDGNIYVADSGNSRIQVFDSSGTFQNEIGSSGPALGQFDYATGLLIVDNVLYIGDNTRLQTFTFDRTAPSVTVTPISGGSTADTTPEIVGSATDSTSPVAGVEYSNSSNPGVWTACTADDGTFDELTEPFTCSTAPALPTGSVTVSIRAVDASNNTTGSGDWATTTFSVGSASVSSAPAAAPQSASHTDTGTPYVPPAPPAPDTYPVIVGSTEATDSITLLIHHWGENIETYKVTYGTESSASHYAAYPLGDVHSESLTIGSLASGTQYYFRLIPMNGSTEGPSSPLFTARTLGVSLDTPSTETTNSVSNKQGVQPLPAPSPQATPALGPSDSPRASIIPRIPDISYWPTPLLIRVALYTGGAIGIVLLLSVTGTIVATLIPLYSLTGRSILLLIPDTIRALLQWIPRASVSLIPFLFGRRRNTSLGVVYSTRNNHPVRGVFLAFYSDSGNLATTFTSVHGTYSVTPRPDHYKIRATKLGYTFPAQSPRAIGMGPLYVLDQIIEVTPSQPTISQFSIALDPR